MSTPATPAAVAFRWSRTETVTSAGAPLPGTARTDTGPEFKPTAMVRVEAFGNVVRVGTKLRAAGFGKCRRTVGTFLTAVTGLPGEACGTGFGLAIAALAGTWIAAAANTVAITIAGTVQARSGNVRRLLSMIFASVPTPGAADQLWYATAPQWIKLARQSHSQVSHGAPFPSHLVTDR